MSPLNAFSNEVVANVDVFRSLMESIVFRECEGRLIVTENSDRDIHLIKFLDPSASQSASLTASEAAMYSASVLDRATVFCLRDDQLTTLPLNFTAIPRCSDEFRISPAGISINFGFDVSRRSVAFKLESIVGRPSEIFKHVIGCEQLIVVGLRIEARKLIDSESQVGAGCERRVEQRADDRLIADLLFLVERSLIAACGRAVQVTVDARVAQWLALIVLEGLQNSTNVASCDRRMVRRSRSRVSLMLRIHSQSPISLTAYRAR